MDSSKNKKLVLMSLMVTYSMVLYLIETMIPNPLIAIFPGAKLGLSNIITLLCLLTFGPKDTFKILTVRIVLSSFFGGSLSMLMYSIAGGYLSLIGMTLVSRVKDLSMIGISVFGATFHNIGQLLMASLIVQTISMLAYLPVMLGASILTGIFIGIVCKYTQPLLDKQIKRLKIEL